METVGNIIDLIMDKSGIQITFLTTLSGTLIYSDASPNQRLDTTLKSIASN